ncbi:unnamed protein product, partial [Brassica oleracea]
MTPLVTYGYHQLMEKCLKSGNPVAHFVQESTTVGLFHLQKSAEGLYDNATYLYGILMLQANVEVIVAGVKT